MKSATASFYWTNDHIRGRTYGVCLRKLETRLGQSTLVAFVRVDAVLTANGAWYRIAVTEQLPKSHSNHFGHRSTE